MYIQILKITRRTHLIVTADSSLQRNLLEFTKDWISQHCYKEHWAWHPSGTLGIHTEWDSCLQVKHVLHKADGLPWFILVSYKLEITVIAPLRLRYSCLDPSRSSAKYTRAGITLPLSCHCSYQNVANVQLPYNSLA